jgi:hypothetical protein
MVVANITSKGIPDDTKCFCVGHQELGDRDRRNMNRVAEVEEEQEHLNGEQKH